MIRGHLAGYRTWRAIAPALVLAYAATASSMSYIQNTEVFPFFNWSLFSSASNPKTDVVMIVRSIDGKTLARPTLFYTLRSFQAARSRDSRFLKTLDKLYIAVKRGDPNAERRLRNLVENVYMAEADHAEYDLAVIQFDPIERLRTGEIRNVTVVRSYRKAS